MAENQKNNDEPSPDVKPDNYDARDNPDLSDLFGPTDEALQTELHAYAKALREEFERSPDPADRAPENVEKYTRDFFKKHLASASAQIVWLSANSTSDSVRLRACQIIVKEALEDARADGDPVKDILNGLMESANKS